MLIRGFKYLDSRKLTTDIVINNRRFKNIIHWLHLYVAAFYLRTYLRYVHMKASF